MKRVLFVSDYFTHGGLETRTLELVSFYKKHGIESFLACDVLAPEHKAIFEDTLQLPLLDTSFYTIVQNTDALVNFCKTNKIDMIDCQPWHCFIPAVLASGIQHLPISYTAHGIYALPSIDDILNPFFYSLLELKRPQCFVVSDFLLDYYKDKFVDCNTNVARNGVSLSNLPKLKIGNSNKWAYASRLSPEKTKPLLDSLPIIERSGVKQLDIFGDGECKGQIEKYIAEHPEGSLKINLRGWCQDLQEELAPNGYTGFFGMDRAAIEAMAIGLPVVILGFNGFGPAVHEGTFVSLLSQNFSSHDRTLSEEEVLRNIADVQKRPKNYNVEELVKKYLDSDQLWDGYLNIVKNIPLDLGRDSMIEFWWEKFYKSVLLERTLSSKEEQIRDLNQRIHELQDTYPQKLARKFRDITRKTGD